MAMYQVNICWQCGDVGFKDALVYCTMCESAPRHSYCMDEVPEDLSAKINWLCEDCRIRFPATSSRIFGRGSQSDTIRPNDPYPGISSTNNHLVNSPVQCPVFDVRVEPSVNVDSHLSYDKGNENSICITGGAPGSLSSSSCFKINEIIVGKSQNEKSEKKLIIRHKDKLNKSHPLVCDRGTDNQFAAKKNRNNSVEAPNMQRSKWTPNCDTNGLDAERSWAFFGVKGDELQEFGRWKLKGRRAKRRRLIFLSKDKLDNFHPHIDGKSTNSFAVKRIPGTVSSSSWFKINEGGKPECWNEKLEKKSLLVPGAEKHIPSLDLQGSNIQFTAEILPVTSVEASEKQIIKQTSDFDIGGLVTEKTYPLGIKDDQIEILENQKLTRRSLVLPSNEELDNFHSLGDSEGFKKPFAAKRLPDVEPFGKEIIGQTTSNEKNIFSAAMSSACSESLSPPLKEQPVADGECAITSLADKMLASSFVESFDNKILMSGSNGSTSASGARTSPHFDLKQSQVEERGKEKTMRSTAILGMNMVDASNMFIAERFSDSSTEAFQNHGLGALDAPKSSSCFSPREDELNDHDVKTSPRQKTQPVNGERVDFHPIIYRQDTDVLIAAKRKHGIFEEVTDRQMTKRDITCDTLAAMPSSARFKLEETGIDRCGNANHRNRRLILKKENDLNSLHPITDGQDIIIKFTDDRLPDTSVVASDRQTIGRSVMKDHSKFPCQRTFHSVPVASHVWSGTFNIGKGELGPLRAHLSSKACEKVCNLAKKLPLVLHMQKFPRMVAWPNSFKISSPTDDNIALYFSPESVRVESALDELVDDIINNDLMLRFQFDEVELLVFSSFVLPQDHQRLYGKYYVWGVFKRRSVPVCSLPVGSQATPIGVTEGCQVDNSLKTASRNEVKDYVQILLKDSNQKINHFTSRRSLIQQREGNVLNTDSTTACDKEKLEVHDFIPSVYVSHLGQREEELRDCNTMCSSELNYVTEEGRSKRPGSVSQFTEEKEISAPSSKSRRICNKSSVSEDENLDSDNSTATDLTAKQQTLLKRPADVKVSKKVPKILPDAEESEVCDDDCFHDSENDEATCLELFPLHVESLGIPFRFRTVKEAEEMKLGLGLTSVDNHGLRHG